MSIRIIGAGLVLAGSAFLAGCQSGSQAQPGQVADTQAGAIRESELRAHCPPVTLQDGTASFAIYERGGEGDPNRLVYQASISETTRTCQYAEDRMTVAVAGRVVPGPRGQPGTISMPIRIVAVRGNDVVYSELFRQSVTITDTSGATQFIFSDPNVSVPGGITRGVRILAGFDEGPL
ncbi:hypothetical protein [Chelativorans sp. Marseille-P2723]|uniref:hypothetical protein n=1 Tax=Chelativorans sp. Marseille-P2723 TaxID=2709133 RepID=UPI00156D792D|nr:hypothetical protein [Chelativorans sp. Marseille-P2723]